MHYFPSIGGLNFCIHFIWLTELKQNKIGEIFFFFFVGEVKRLINVAYLDHYFLCIIIVLLFNQQQIDFETC